MLCRQATACIDIKEHRHHRGRLDNIYKARGISDEDVI